MAVAGLLLPTMELLISLGAATLIFLTLEFLRFRVSSVNNWFFLHFRLLLTTTGVSCLTGTRYLLIASLIAFLAFERHIAVLALSFLAVGDATAAVVGTQIDKMR